MNVQKNVKAKHSLDLTARDFPLDYLCEWRCIHYKHYWTYIQSSGEVTDERRNA